MTAATPVTRLELRFVAIPRGFLVQRLEEELGRPLTLERRHYLADRPVHCGDSLQIYLDGAWIEGRYEWTGRPDELPTFLYEGGMQRIDDNCLVRWPMKWEPRG